MDLLSDFFKAVERCVNSSIGSDYREIYFKHYPSPYHTCKRCKKKLNRNTPREVTIDHIIPRRYYGTNAITNLQVLCQPCNSRKRDLINGLSLEYSGDALLRELRKITNF